MRASVVLPQIFLDLTKDMSSLMDVYRTIIDWLSALWAEYVVDEDIEHDPY